jgi:hypothetical protein
MLSVRTRRKGARATAASKQEPRESLQGTLPTAWPTKPGRPSLADQACSSNGRGSLTERIFDTGIEFDAGSAAGESRLARWHGANCGEVQRDKGTWDDGCPAKK